MRKDQLIEFVDKMLSSESAVSSKRVHALIGHAVLIIYLFTIGGPNFALAYLGYIAAVQGLTVIDGLKGFKDNKDE